MCFAELLETDNTANRSVFFTVDGDRQHSKERCFFRVHRDGQHSKHFFKILLLLTEADNTVNGDVFMEVDHKANECVIFSLMEADDLFKQM